MTVVYVREQGAVVRKDGELLRVTQEKRDLFTVPLANLEQFVLLGNVQLTTQAATLLLRAEVDVVFMSQYGRYKGRLITLGSKFAKLRHEQLRMVDDDARTLATAKQIVVGKITNQRVLLQRRENEGGGLGRALKSMAEMRERAGGARNLDQLRGFEGKAAADYFDGMRSFFGREWGFQKREYHPSPDPANALLSFAYGLLRKDVEAQIQIVGLDPYLGFFHALGYDRPALALDVMEEFRPTIADQVVLSLVSGGQITVQDFERTNLPDRPVQMSKPAITRLIEAYEARLAEEVFHPLANGQTAYRRAIELQVRLMARVVDGTARVYEPLVMR